MKTKLLFIFLFVNLQTFAQSAIRAGYHNMRINFETKRYYLEDEPIKGKGWIYIDYLNGVADSMYINIGKIYCHDKRLSFDFTNSGSRKIYRTKKDDRWNSNPNPHPHFSFELEYELNVNNYLGNICDTVFVYSDDGILLCDYEIRFPIFNSIIDVKKQMAFIQFKEPVHNFDTLPEGPDVKCSFEFINTGGERLILCNVSGSCGCITPEWTKQPILPGDSSEIVINYTTNGRPGSFNRGITVTSNAFNSEMVLRINGFVKEKKLEINSEEKRSGIILQK